MTFEIIREVLGWCSVINIVFLTFWTLLMMLAKDFVCGIHGGLFNLPDERVAEILYTLLLFFKICIILFNSVPYIAICIVD